MLFFNLLEKTNRPGKKNMSEVRIESWNHLEEELFADSWHDNLQRLRTRSVFRGLSNSNYKLTTTLQRMGGKYKEVEIFMLRNFKKYAHRDVVERDTFWHWLSIAQHHGLPTRLMDWSNSPFAALHFVTNNIDQFDVDGTVWIVNIYKAYEYLPTILKKILGDAKAFTIEELNKAVKSFEELENLSSDEFMLFFEPPSIDDRIVNQYAVFSLMSGSTTVPEDWLFKHPGLSRKLIIPAVLKSEIRDKLDMANATERVFFPGLDGLCSWLKRYYGPSTRQIKEQKSALFEGKFLHFFRDESGWEYVHRPNALKGVTIIAVTKENKLVLVEQYRPPIGKNVIELPAGLVGDRESNTLKEKLVSAVKRELEEETGYQCKKVTLLTEGSALPGVSDELNSICFAENLARVKDGSITIEANGGIFKHTKTRGLLKEGEKINVYEVPIEKVVGWLEQQRNEGKVIDLKIFSGLFFAYNQLKMISQKNTEF